MGSQGPSPPTSSADLQDADEVVVVVTGFGHSHVIINAPLEPLARGVCLTAAAAAGPLTNLPSPPTQPFKYQYPVNPSWSIVSSLPPFLPHPAAAAAAAHEPSAHEPSSHAPSSPSPRTHPRIRILTHPSPIRVSYSAVRALVPRLWSPSGPGPGPAPPRIDFMVHLGMAAGRDFYSVERRGHRDGYVMADVDGVVLGDERRRYGDGLRGGDGDEKWVWEGCPVELETGVDVDDVWRRWRAALPDVDVRSSEDAGRYLCDFIYYSSLAELWKQNEERRVVFLHVPVDSDDESIATGREVLIELIRALVQSRKMTRLAQQHRENQKLVT